MGLDTSGNQKTCTGEGCSNLLPSKEKTPAGAFGRFCGPCRNTLANQSKPGKGGSKRGNDSLSPLVQSRRHSKKGRPFENNFDEFLHGIDAADSAELKDRIHTLITLGRELETSNIQLQEELKNNESSLDECKIAFANEFLKFCSNVKPGPAQSDQPATELRDTTYSRRGSKP